MNLISNIIRGLIGLPVIVEQPSEPAPERIPTVASILTDIAQLSDADRAALLEALRPTPVVATKPKTAKAKGMTGQSFWTAYRSAQDAIIVEYGTAWKVRAVPGDTVLARLPAKYRSWKTERGTVLRYNPDQRLPGARFWPRGELPEGLDIVPPARPVTGQYDGMILHDGEWTWPVLANIAMARAEQSERDREIERENWSADNDDVQLAEAAD